MGVGIVRVSNRHRFDFLLSRHEFKLCILSMAWLTATGLYAAGPSPVFVGTIPFLRYCSDNLRQLPARKSDTGLCCAQMLVC